MNHTAHDWIPPESSIAFASNIWIHAARSFQCSSLTYDCTSFLDVFPLKGGDPIRSLVQYSHPKPKAEQWPHNLTDSPSTWQSPCAACKNAIKFLYEGNLRVRWNLKAQPFALGPVWVCESVRLKPLPKNTTGEGISQTVRQGFPESGICAPEVKGVYRRTGSTSKSVYWAMLSNQFGAVMFLDSASYAKHAAWTSSKCEQYVWPNCIHDHVRLVRVSQGLGPFCRCSHFQLQLHSTWQMGKTWRIVQCVAGCTAGRHASCWDEPIASKRKGPPAKMWLKVGLKIGRSFMS